ncbi:hypothetical protein EON63_14065 [archaeon]|nr:MAG: hypothetical protein EON63_14065 [archaeon]
MTEPVNLSLLSFEQTVFIECKATHTHIHTETEAATSTHTYSVRLNVAEVPGDTEEHTALEATCLTDEKKVDMVYTFHTTTM